eukprot:1847079-Pleurochrysis_carterae.AAC.2
MMNYLSRREQSPRSTVLLPRNTRPECNKTPFFTDQFKALMGSRHALRGGGGAIRYHQMGFGGAQQHFYLATPPYISQNLPLLPPRDIYGTSNYYACRGFAANVNKSLKGRRLDCSTLKELQPPKKDKAALTARASFQH